MLYEVINQDGKVMAGTTYKSCIYPMDLMNCTIDYKKKS